jgi:alcohol dehydrogenase class IV
VAPGLFAEVQANPTRRNVEAGVAAFTEHRADGIIALGGGSGLDGPKTIAILAACGVPPGVPWPITRQRSRARRFPLIAIPHRRHGGRGRTGIITAGCRRKPGTVLLPPCSRW